MCSEHRWWITYWGDHMCLICGEYHARKQQGQSGFIPDCSCYIKVTDKRSSRG